MATQEPTLSTDLIDLCDITIVHRFRSPAWFETLTNHLAGVRLTSGNGSDIFETIVGLQTGEALLFSPTAILDLQKEARSKEGESAAGENKGDGIKPLQQPTPKQLQGSYISIRIRQRITADGGKSIMASDAGPPRGSDSEMRTAASPTSSSNCSAVPPKQHNAQTNSKSQKKRAQQPTQPQRQQQSKKKKKGLKVAE